MESDKNPSQAQRFKGVSFTSKTQFIRHQLGELKIKCAASLCILLVLLFETLVRRIEQSYIESSPAVLNSTKLE